MEDKYAIKLPIIEESIAHGGFLEITKSSPKEHLEALEQLASYFKREFKYDGIQFCSNEHIGEHVEYSGFVFTESAYDAMKEGDSVTPTRFLGGGCFRNREHKDGKHWWLDWVWIHPYARNKGLLTKQINYFKERFGDFYPEPPLSKTMQHIYDTQINT